MTTPRFIFATCMLLGLPSLLSLLAAICFSAAARACWVDASVVFSCTLSTVFDAVPEVLDVAEAVADTVPVTPPNPPPSDDPPALDPPLTLPPMAAVPE
jgi:hypothetical protein